MKAKDRIISIDDLLLSGIDFNKPLAVWLKQSLKAQDKISIKRGRDYGFEVGMEQGEAEGIRKVVEWVESNGHQDSVIYSEWKAFLKSIGYKEEK